MNVETLNLRTAFTNTVFDLMEKDCSIFLIGEGQRIKLSFDSPKILERFADRVITAPISEGGMVNVALGATLNGMHPIVDLTFNDLVLRAMDEIVNQAGKLHYMSAGKLNPRMIIKADFNRPENAQSGNRMENFFLHQTGLNVMIPSNPTDMRYFVNYALTHDGVYMLFEDRLVRPAVPYATCPEFGEARIVKEGSKVTAISYGYGLQLVVEAAKNKEGVEIIDLRTLSPLDNQTVFDSVLKTERVIIVESTSGLRIGDEIQAKIGLIGLHPSMIKRVSAKYIPFPAVKSLQEQIMPSVEEVRTKMEELL